MQLPLSPDVKTISLRAPCPSQPRLRNLSIPRDHDWRSVLLDHVAIKIRQCKRGAQDFMCGHAPSGIWSIRSWWHQDEVRSCYFLFSQFLSALEFGFFLLRIWSGVSLDEQGRMRTFFSIEIRYPCKIYYDRSPIGCTKYKANDSLLRITTGGHSSTTPIHHGRV